jgi:hypothetical protein
MLMVAGFMIGTGGWKSGRDEAGNFFLKGVGLKKKRVAQDSGYSEILGDSL